MFPVNANERHDRSWSQWWFTGLCWIQGLYYLGTGVWPIVSIRSFQAVTGPKTDHLPTGREADHWLVMTVGALVIAVALTLLLAAIRRTRTAEIVVLAMASAGGLLLIDVIYVVRGVIAPIYLADAALDVLLLAGWASVVILGSKRSEHLTARGATAPVVDLQEHRHSGI